MRSSGRSGVTFTVKEGLRRNRDGGTGSVLIPDEYTRIGRDLKTEIVLCKIDDKINRLRTTV